MYGSVFLLKFWILSSFPRLLHSRFGILSMMLQGFYVKFFEERRKRNRSTSLIHAIDTNKDKGRWSYHFNKCEQTSTMLEQLKKTQSFLLRQEYDLGKLKFLRLFSLKESFSRSIKCSNEVDANQTMPTPDLWKGNIKSNLKKDASVHLTKQQKQSFALLSFWMLWSLSLLFLSSSVLKNLCALFSMQVDCKFLIC